MTPNKLPPLPAPWIDRGDNAPIMAMNDYFTADQMHAYAAEAIRQSQSLPAGAVAGLSAKVMDSGALGIVTMHVDCAYFGPHMIGEGDEVIILKKSALQADAREKGEAVAWRSKDYQPWLNGGFAWAYTSNPADIGPQHESLYLATPDYGCAILLLEQQRDLVENLRGQISDRNEEAVVTDELVEMAAEEFHNWHDGSNLNDAISIALRKALETLATQPAQASEKDNG